MPTVSPKGMYSFAPGEREGLLASYGDANSAYRSLLDTTAAGMPGASNEKIYTQPGVRDAFDKAQRLYGDLTKYGIAPIGDKGPTYWSGNGGGFGLGGALGKIAHFVLPQLGAVGGAIDGAMNGGGFSGALKGALKSGLSTAAAIAVPQLSKGLGIGDFLSGSSLSSTPAKLPGLSTGASSGGGFLSGIGDSITGFLDDPIGGITSALEDTLKPSNLLKSGLKFGLSSALQKDNSGGYGAIQNAANTAAGYSQPFLQSGTAANAKIADLYGLNGPDAQKAAFSGFQTSPGYDFAKTQGIRALDASAAKKGLLLSGNQQQAVQEFGTGLANQEFNNYIANLVAQARQGQSAAQDVGQNQVDAATAYAMMKANKANNSNSRLASLLDFL